MWLIKSLLKYKLFLLDTFFFFCFFLTHFPKLTKHHKIIICKDEDIEDLSMDKEEILEVV